MTQDKKPSLFDRISDGVGKVASDSLGMLPGGLRNHFKVGVAEATDAGEDRSTRLEIGGSVSRDLIPVLVAGLLNQGMIGPDDDLNEHVNDRGVLELKSKDSSDREFEELETWLEEHEIEFDWYSTGSTAGKPELVSFRRHLGHINRITSHGDQVALTENELSQFCATTHGPPTWAMSAQVIPSLTPFYIQSKQPE